MSSLAAAGRGAAGAPEDEMSMELIVGRIRNVDHAPEFDIVRSVGLIERFPDEYRSVALGFHHRFVNPGAWVVMTTSRDQPRGRAYQTFMSDHSSVGYRGLMDVWRMGLQATANGLDARRAGVTRAHDGLRCEVRGAARGLPARPPGARPKKYVDATN
jgi:hypothetical protein